MGIDQVLVIPTMVIQNIPFAENAEGVEASRMFLESMTAHHEGAIDMAQDEVDNGQNPDAVELAETIVETQQAEIDQMQQLLATL